MSTVGERIREAREARGLGVNELARKANLSQGLLSRIENAKGGTQRGITDKTIGKLAAALDVRAAWLVSGEGPRDIPGEEPLPRRAEAIRVAREGGVTETVLEAVQAAIVPDAESKSTWWWCQAIARREVYLREEGALPPSSKAPLTMLSPAPAPASSHHRPVVKRSS